MTPSGQLGSLDMAQNPNREEQKEQRIEEKRKIRQREKKQKEICPVA
jgi:hypothetical protein